MYRVADVIILPHATRVSWLHVYNRCNTMPLNDFLNLTNTNISSNLIWNFTHLVSGLSPPCVCVSISKCSLSSSRELVGFGIFLREASSQRVLPLHRVVCTLLRVMSIWPGLGERCLSVPRRAANWHILAVYHRHLTWGWRHLSSADHSKSSFPPIFVDAWQICAAAENSPDREHTCLFCLCMLF